jgi:hypothetical protein
MTQVKAKQEQILLPTLLGHRGSSNYRLNNDGIPGFGMLMDEQNQHV